MDHQTRLKDLRRLREDIRVEYMTEIKTMTGEILAKAREANDTPAVELIEKYVLPIVEEHLDAAKNNQSLQPEF